VGPQQVVTTLVRIRATSVCYDTEMLCGQNRDAPRVQRDLLYRAGIIVPRLRGHAAADQFAPKDLDAFLARLLDGAKPAASVRAGQVRIQDAAKMACCGSIEVVQLVLGGKLKRKWRLASERGYMSLLIDLEEVAMPVDGVVSRTKHRR
jgi:hypothetical protein